MDDLRAAVVVEAKSWLKTPYHHMARVKGAGVDCAMLLAEVYAKAGVIPALDIPAYSPQWHLHHSAERYLDFVLAQSREIPGPPEPGDVVLFKVGRCHAHGGIVIDWPLIVHASAEAGAVVMGDAERDSFSRRPLRDREPRFFRLKGV